MAARMLSCSSLEPVEPRPAGRRRRRRLRSDEREDARRRGGRGARRVSPRASSRSAAYSRRVSSMREPQVAVRRPRRSGPGSGRRGARAASIDVVVAVLVGVVGQHADLLGELERRRRPTNTDSRANSRRSAGAEQVVAPVDRPAQRPLARRQVAAAALEQAEPVVQAPGHRRGREQPDPGRGQLDRQRQPVEVADDLRRRPARSRP